jgi:aspartate ammonia-lyase
VVSAHHFSKVALEHFRHDIADVARRLLLARRTVMKWLKSFLLAFCLLFAVVSAKTKEKSRTEGDLPGEREVPADAYYGVQTARTLENFRISGVDINRYPGFVEAWAIVKLAAARANTDVGAMKPEKLAVIEKACNAVFAGKYHDQFVVDWYQGGAGTSKTWAPIPANSN